jgi:hypothetical protein
VTSVSILYPGNHLKKTRGKGLKGNHKGGAIDQPLFPADCNTSDVIVKVWPYGLVDMIFVRYRNCRQGSLKIDKFCFLKLVRLDSEPGSLQNLKVNACGGRTPQQGSRLLFILYKGASCELAVVSPAKLSRSKGGYDESRREECSFRT